MWGREREREHNVYMVKEFIAHVVRIKGGMVAVVATISKFSIMQLEIYLRFHSFLFLKEDGNLKPYNIMLAV